MPSPAPPLAALPALRVPTLVGPLRPVTYAGAAFALLGLAACSSSDTAAPTASDRVFVTQAGSSTVIAIDAASGEPEARIDVGMLPHNLVVSPDQRSLYVALVGSQAVAEVDVATLSVRRTMLTAPVPERREKDDSIIQEHIDQNAFEATTCYGCHRPGGAEPKYAGDRPFGLLLSPDGRRLYVTHLRGSRLTVLDLEQGELESTTLLEPAGPATEVVAIDRLNDDELWIVLRAPQPSKLPGAVRRLDAGTFEPLAEVPTGADPAAMLAVPAHESVLVSNFESNTVTVHTASESSGRKIAAAPGPYGLLELGASEVLALDYYADAISFLDLESGTAETLPLEANGVSYANPTHAALSTDRRSAWLVSSGTDGHLLELDLRSRSIVRDIEIDGLSFDVAVTSGIFP